MIDPGGTVRNRRSCYRPLPFPKPAGETLNVSCSRYVNTKKYGSLGYQQVSEVDAKGQRRAIPGLGDTEWIRDEGGEDLSNGGGG